MRYVGTILICALIIGSMFAVVDYIKERAYCACLGSQPYITTKYYEGRCLMQVLSYEELDIVQYLFICEGRCR